MFYCPPYSVQGCIAYNSKEIYFNVIIMLFCESPFILIQAKDDKEKQQRMKQLKSSDKLIEKLCLICNHCMRPKCKHMLVKFLTYHQYLIDPLFKLCKSKLDKFYGMMEYLVLIVTNKKNKQMEVNC